MEGQTQCKNAHNDLEESSKVEGGVSIQEAHSQEDFIAPEQLKEENVPSSHMVCGQDKVTDSQSEEHGEEDSFSSESEDQCKSSHFSSTSKEQGRSLDEICNNADISSYTEKTNLNEVPQNTEDTMEDDNSSCENVEQAVLDPIKSRKKAKVNLYNYIIHFTSILLWKSKLCE
jgi:hypothetical protein